MITKIFTTMMFVVPMLAFGLFITHGERTRLTQDQSDELFVMVNIHANEIEFQKLMHMVMEHPPITRDEYNYIVNFKGEVK